MKKITLLNGKILVVGGYGSVGRIISTELGERFPGRVIAAGRDFSKAQALSHGTGMKVLPLKLDVFNLCEDELPNDIGLVIMCLDLPDTTFVKKCLRQGISYVDISATYELLSQIELLDVEAKEHEATVVLSVGLAPGLTNLLAAHCAAKFERMERADIFIMLGLGEAHGEAAIRWTIENLNSVFSIWDEGVATCVASFGEGKRTVFPSDIGARTAFRFNFSDQQVIPKTLGIPSASTWACFDSALMTHVFAFYKKMGLFGLLRFRQVRESLVKVFKHFHVGSDTFVVKVDGRGRINGQNTSYECAITGRGEGRGTALVAIEVAAAVFKTPSPSGVFHIEQLFNPREIISPLIERGLRFQEGDIFYKAK